MTKITFMLNLETYFKKGISYESYIEKTENQLEEEVENGDPKEFVQHYSMGLQRMNRITKSFQFSDVSLAEIEKASLDKSIRLLTITEGWCGDASQIVPVVHLLAEKLGIENRYISRDENLELIERYKTNGALSIPIVLGIDSEGKELFHYGPRPQKGMELLKKFKENPDKYSKDEFHADLQKFYNTNKGEDIIHELLSLMNA
ncbi:thioredoxin family protein [Weeksella virosa]|nr:thioredoxin family protein [Weeksella virosa]